MQPVRQELAAVLADMPAVLPAAGGISARGTAQEGHGRAPEALADGGAVGAAGRALALPWPPSTNRIWRTVLIGGSPRTLLSAHGRQYRQDVLRIAAGKKTLTGRLSVAVEAFPPDRRRRDMDNLLKAVLDACTHAGVWQDDSQIDELSIRRREQVNFGLVRVYVREIAL